MEIQNRNIVDEKYYYLSSVPSDINEHLPILKKYTEECDSVLELGVRWIVATWAFLAGKPKNYIGLDIEHPSFFGADITELRKGAVQNNVNFHFIVGDDLNSQIYNQIPNVDLTFIDTDHTYNQVKSELEIYHLKTNKYIILHDTISFRYGGFNGDEKGIWSAITEFTHSHPEWEIWESFANNNGLTILRKKSSFG
jgi:cephalosporin hydroxylase